MIVFHDPAEVPEGFGPSVVAIGKFDGVHAGHRAVIERARVDATPSGAKVVAVTFDRNPLRTLRPEICPDDLVGLTQKLRLLDEAGVDATLVLHFDAELAGIPAEDFVRNFLVGALGATMVLVGRDFRFGRGGTGNPDLLSAMGEALGFRVDVIDDIRAIEGERRVSSTWIRELLAAGEVEAASRLLGRAPSVWGEVVHGLKRGRELGFPTANIVPDDSLVIPGHGVYAAFANGVPSAVNVGVRPTFESGRGVLIETYLIDRSEDLYGSELRVAFVERLRGEKRFAGVEDLIAQMKIDVEDARRVCASFTDPG